MPHDGEVIEKRGQETDQENDQGVRGRTPPYDRSGTQGAYSAEPRRRTGSNGSRTGGGKPGHHLVILISFDIDGTLEVGDPPGVLTMDMVRRARDRGFLIGSCSDRPISAQRAIWGQHNISIDFAVGKMMLPDVKAQFEADVYCHIGDREDLDKKYALAAGFEFLWPDEAIMQSWFLMPRGYPGH